MNDHAALYDACQAGHEIIGVYCYAPSLFESKIGEFPKTGIFRKKFIEESVLNLQQQWQKMGGELLILHAEPEYILPAICRHLQINTVAVHAEVAHEEAMQENRVETALHKLDIKLNRYFDTHSLLQTDDLPFNIKQLPDLFTTFRHKAEKQWNVRNTYSKPNYYYPIKAESIKSELPFYSLSVSSNSNQFYKGGETTATIRLQYYLWDTQFLSTYKITRNGMLGTDYSSRLSAWLAAGCISARTIYFEIKKYEARYGANESTYWLIFELLWRDYFRFVFMKHESALFQLHGISKQSLTWLNDEIGFEKWRTGNTGFSLVDACMRELFRTGYLSNRGRQIVSNFLAKQLHINWLWGAQWFESQLIDYDVYSNYGNWAYQAGVGNDARNDRVFNLDKQAAQYDADGAYVRKWLV
jgi:deoxyribodipyrimidine photo-lyase